MSALPSFTSLEWSTLPGRGDVAVVVLDRNYQRSQMLKDLAKVLIDGLEYEVIGIESFAIESQRKGLKVGLLVEKRR